MKLSSPPLRDGASQRAQPNTHTLTAAGVKHRYGIVDPKG